MTGPRPFNFGMSRRKTFAIVFALLFVSAIAFVAAVINWIGPPLRHKRMRHYHMTWIEYGAHQYKQTHKVFPTAIAQMVEDGILPGESEIYACPLLLTSPLPLFPPARDYRDSDYILINSNEFLYIQMRSNIAQQVMKRYPEFLPEALFLKTELDDRTIQMTKPDGTSVKPPVEKIIPKRRAKKM
jgi:hypothetical protein